MLQTFYNNFGFAGALTVVFMLFIFIVFWVAGLAGICISQRKGNPGLNLTVFLAILFPPYPFFWMIWEIYSQRKQLREAE